MGVKRSAVKTGARIRRERQLAGFAHRLSGAMSGKGEVGLQLRNGAKLTGVPDRIPIDKSLQGRCSNLRVFMGGYNFPLDDVVDVW